MAAAFPSPSSLWPAAGSGGGGRRTLALAGGALGLLALAQGLALVWFLATGGVATRRSVSVSPASFSASATAGPNGRPLPLAESDAPATVRRDFPTLATGPSLPAPAPVPLSPSAALNSPGADSVPSILDTPTLASISGSGGGGSVLALPTPAPRYQPNPTDLVEQAKRLRASGDTQTALAKLREAQGISADNPLVIAEMALTYEAMQLPDRAAIQWQRLFDLGESIGAPYYLAQMKLRQSNAGGGTEAGLMMAASAAATASGGASTTTAPRGPSPETSLAQTPGTGFAANAILRIVEAKQEEIADPNADRKVALRTVIKNKPGTAIDPRRVKVYAEFYDLVDGKDIVQTDADTGFQWLTSPVDWNDDASEILETTYFRPRGTSGGAPSSASSSTPLLPPPPATPAANAKGKRGGKSSTSPPASSATSPIPGPVRSYIGYVVRLYYDRQLQDCKAEPERLLQQFAPAPTLPAE